MKASKICDTLGCPRFYYLAPLPMLDPIYQYQWTDSVDENYQWMWRQTHHDITDKNNNVCSGDLNIYWWFLHFLFDLYMAKSKYTHIYIESLVIYVVSVIDYNISLFRTASRSNYAIIDYTMLQSASIVIFRNGIFHWPVKRINLIL
jgi:hypothetical protein